MTETPLTQTDIRAAIRRVADMIADTMPWLTLPDVTLHLSDYAEGAFGFLGIDDKPCVVLTRTLRPHFSTMSDAELGKYLWWRLQQTRPTKGK